MKTPQVFKAKGSALLIAGFLGCGSSATSPGSGPAFSSITPTLTAADVWLAVTNYAYHGETTGGAIGPDYDCEGGGTVHKGAPASQMTYTYSHCVFTAHFFFPVQSLQLEANGEVSVTVPANQSSLSDSLQLHISFSGDLGFSEDCDYTEQLGAGLLPTSFSGTCTYRDSAGQELIITGDEMLTAFATTQ
ncbi:MAG: hypothetical protein V1798_11175 [Pseudomonadota bacterium]